MSDLPGFHDLTAWQIERLELRRRLWALLGDLPPLFTPTPVFDLAAQHPGFTLHHFSFDNEAGFIVEAEVMQRETGVLRRQVKDRSRSKKRRQVAEQRPQPPS